MTLPGAFSSLALPVNRPVSLPVVIEMGASVNLGPAVFYALALAYAALGLGIASASVQFTYEMRHQPRPVWERALDSAVATLGVLTGAGLVLFAAVGAIQGPP